MLLEGLHGAALAAGLALVGLLQYSKTAGLFVVGPAVARDPTIGVGLVAALALWSAGSALVRRQRLEPTLGGHFEGTVKGDGSCCLGCTPAKLYGGAALAGLGWGAASHLFFFFSSFDPHLN